MARPPDPEPFAVRTPLPLIAALCAAPVLAQAADPARAPVQALDDGLLAIMKAGRAAGVAGRAQRIEPVVDRSFDLALMTRLCVGPAWTGIAPADQAALVAAFRRLTVQQYAKNFDGYAGETFTLDPRIEERGGDKLVRTTLNAKDGPVAISYRLRDTGSGWRIIDVFYKNAISQLATRRSDFAAVLQAGGAKALIAHLDQLAAKPAA
jgi:phospholipid transport system substrate-binding protein